MGNQSKEYKITLFEKIINQLKFNIYEVDSDLEVFVTFETMNNRGKSLSKLELLKNRLIYLCEKLQGSEIDKDKLREEINDSWKKIYHYLGKNQQNTLDDDDFLKNHWIMYFPDYNRNEASAFSTFLLKEKFTIKNLVNKKLDSKDIKSYVESLKISIENYFFILNPTFEDSKKYKFDKSVKYLEKLNRLGFSSFLPLITATLNKEISDEDLSKLLAAIEQFIFVVFDISRSASTFRNSTFFKYAYEYNNSKITKERLLTEIKKIKEDNTDINLLKAWILNKFIKGKGYYDWYDELRYLLFEYELFIKNKKGINEDKIVWDDFKNLKKDYVSIEHIFPQSKIKTERDKINCHSLGNLIPLSIPRNSKFQDNDFKLKVKEYAQGSLSEREICDNSTWGETEIKERGLKLINFMLKRWEIKDIDDKTKLELLGYQEDVQK